MVFYEFEGGLYLNITNRCPTACSFCVKTRWDWSFRGRDLLLPHEPSRREILDGLEARLGPTTSYRELVFCGYGEPTQRLDVLLAAARHARHLRPDISVRLNTVGLGRLICGRDIVPDLRGAVDRVSVSVNTADPAQWLTLHRPRPEYRAAGFAAACAFAADCAAAGLRTRVTAVDRPDVDLPAVEALARSLGAEFFLRPQLEDLGASTQARPVRRRGRNVA
ncbi:MAG: radical SAM protein [Elusimicrobia bacterium]|nr:radical SAM protein [Elusimicrobiota bacterium]